MRRAVGEFELDDDRQRVDLDFVHAFLSSESYWARGRFTCAGRALAEAQ